MTGFRWTADEVRAALGLDAPVGMMEFTGISTDTRHIAPGSLFVALRGANFDGHDYLAQAAQSGALAAIVSRAEGAPEGMPLFVVPDTLHALGALGRHRRRALGGRVVAVAGSNGKTTTKELLRAVLSPAFRVHATDANLNNQVGVPLTLLATPDEAEAVIVETGTNEPGEITLLSRIVEPDAALITSIGEEHLEGLGSVEGVLQEELAVFDGLRQNGVGVVADEPNELPEGAMQRIGGVRLRVAGFSSETDLRPDGGKEGVRFRPDGSTEWSFRGVPVHLPLPGMHNVRNALLALGVAVEWGVPLEDAVRGLGAMKAPKMRNEWVRIGPMNLIADCYNANPPSMRAALDLLATVPAEGEKIAVIGTMRELGDHGDRLHRELALHAAGLIGHGIDRVVATGEFVRAFGENDSELGDRLIAAEDPLQAYEALRPTLRGGETLLLKGSRGVQLERLLPLIERDFAQGSPQTA
ncbi:UDP-N-acetylmuramoyl-tripeptide--D-alanyl-D-alanine ligase [Longimicrobium sp.]|uniref:UDP-N-acetylmuramoyl-tripeptide--D-alanyl-D- alanine ligase n=1 Tax=Longimicrobium sp. TaxID=2029185 RepID=UPI002E37A8CD|nr:UDP-N-acetylmuramoyl-tripeptide--D-alanyl-D-alanine ligase [Longimicrobium sp.]HEX6037106.1 UDP-N-acetylmuramoyl-tripeptide--D-alanyl-D-alanine ligase [Longimicrobium sp.]